MFNAIFIENEGKGDGSFQNSKGFRTGVKTTSFLIDAFAISNPLFLAFQMFNLWVDTIDPYDINFVIGREYIEGGYIEFLKMMNKVMGKDLVKTISQPIPLPSPLYYKSYYESCFEKDYIGPPTASCPLQYRDRYKEYIDSHGEKYKTQNIRTNEYLFNIMRAFDGNKK